MAAALKQYFELSKVNNKPIKKCLQTYISPGLTGLQINI
jgi:hypothetical protein